MSQTRLTALALAAATLVAGCGGSTTHSSSPAGASSQASASQPASTTQASMPVEAPAGTPRLRKAVLISRADAICARLNKGAASVRTTTLQSVGATAPALAGHYRTALAGLRKLAPPAAMGGDWSAMLADVELVENEILKMGRYATANDTASTVRVENGIETVQLRRFAIAKRDGFRDCGEL